MIDRCLKIRELGCRNCRMSLVAWYYFGATICGSWHRRIEPRIIREGSGYCQSLDVLNSP